MIFSEVPWCLKLVRAVDIIIVNNNLVIKIAADLVEHIVAEIVRHNFLDIIDIVTEFLQFEINFDFCPLFFCLIIKKII